MIEIQEIKFTKLFLPLVILISALSLPSVAEAVVPAPVTVTVEGEPLVMPVPPVIVNDRTMVAARFGGEAVGATVEWNQELRQALLTRGRDSVLLTLGSAEAVVNGQILTLEVPAQLIEQRTMVPLRFIAEALGGSVEWDGLTRTANILRKPTAITAMTYSRDIGISRVTLTFSEPLMRITPVVGEKSLALDLYPAVVKVEEPARVIFDTLMRVIALQGEDRTVRFEAFPWTNPQFRHSLSEGGTVLVVEFPHIVTGLEFQHDGRRPVVSIGANGKLNFTTTQLKNPDRLVLDIAGAQLAPDVQTNLEIGTPYLTAVRSSQFSRTPDSVRVVLDLAMPIPYEVVSTDLGLQVRFLPQIESVDAEQFPGKTRLTFGGTLPMDAKVTVFEQQRQILIQVPQTRSDLKKSEIEVADGTIDTIEMKPLTVGDGTLITIHLPYYLGHTTISRDGQSNIMLDVITSPVYGKRIWLDAGHGKVAGGTNDPGAIGSLTGLKEKDINLSVTLELQRMLLAGGAVILMTRTGDEGPDFRDRAALVNAVAPPVDLFISLHHNSVTNNTTRGTETYYWTTNPKSRRVAEVIHAALRQGLGFPDRMVRMERFNVIRDTLAPAVLLEFGYLSHPNEERAIAQPSYPAVAAQSAKNGIFDYFWQEIRTTVAN